MPKNKGFYKIKIIFCLRLRVSQLSLDVLPFVINIRGYT